MGKDPEVFVGLDVAKVHPAVAVAEEGRQGAVRYIGEIGTDDDGVHRLVAKLEQRHSRLHFCYEGGPTGYGLYRHNKLNEFMILSYKDAGELATLRYLPGWQSVGRGEIFTGMADPWPG